MLEHNPCITYPPGLESMLNSESKKYGGTEMKANLTDSWEKQQEVDYRDSEEYIQLQEFMQDIKRYIRSIDISSL